MTTNSLPTHPTYGTCTGCTQAKRIDKYGRVREHSYTAASGGLLLTLTCPGSGGPYSEVARTVWNARLSRWQDMPIEVDATLHPLGDGEPQQVCVSIHSWPSTKAGHARFVERGMSIHLKPANEDGSVFRAELGSAEGTVTKVEEARNDGSVEGLVLRWMEQIGKNEPAVKS